MKKRLQQFNTSHFLQRVILFFIFLMGIHLIYEVFNGNPSVVKILRTNLYGKIITSVIFGLFDSRTWDRSKHEEKAPQRFTTLKDALRFYVLFAFFIAAICLLFSVILGALVLLALWIFGIKAEGSIGSSLKTIGLMIGIISIVLTLYDATRNYLQLRKKEQSS